MRLHVEDVTAVNRVPFDLVQDNLTAKMFVSEVQGHLGDRIGFDAIGLQLSPVVLNDLLDFLMDATEVMSALGDPLILAVVLEFEDSWGDDSVHDVRVDFLGAGQVALGSDVDDHGHEQQVLVEGELVLHVADLREHLESHESETGEILTELGLLYLVGQVEVLLEDQSRQGSLGILSCGWCS